MSIDNFDSISIETLPQFVTAVLTVCFELPADRAAVIALHGDLGAGKTTFVQELARQLKVTDTVTSPTFVVLKKYETKSEQFSHLAHMDAYRIESEAELPPLRFSELLKSPNTLVCIEWAERISSALPSGTIHIHLAVASDTNRTVQVSRL